MLERCFFLTSTQGVIIDVNSNDVSVQQFCFYKRGTAACKLIKKQISLF